MTKRQRKREYLAKFIDKIAVKDKPSQFSKQLRATNRRIEKKKSVKNGQDSAADPELESSR